ncbi:MAG: ABC transporter permease [Acidobacteria bacterium]|nr:ABC transporter permease [Acidobacteriota bacterium]
MNRALAAGIGVLTLLAALAAGAPALSAAGVLARPDALDTSAGLAPPSLEHWMGTDELGRDVLSRVLHGGRPSLVCAFVATLVALGVGLPAGALAGLRGGWWDLILTRLMEATTAVPALLVILLLAAILPGDPDRAGSARLVPLAVAIGLTRWAVIARYVRGAVVQAQAEDYAAAAEALGAGRARVLFRHLLPGALTPALVTAAFGAGSAILAESALSFFGLGTHEPLPSWGKMIASAAVWPRAWWLIVAPGAVIAIVVMGFNLSAEGLRLRAASGREETQPRVGGGFRLPDR